MHEAKRVFRVHRPLYPSRRLYENKRKTGDRPRPGDYRLYCARIGADMHRAIQARLSGAPVRPAFQWIEEKLSECGKEYITEYNKQLQEIADIAVEQLQAKEGYRSIPLSEVNFRLYWMHVLEMEQLRWQLASGKVNDPEKILEASNGTWDENDRFQPNKLLPSAGNLFVLEGRKRVDFIPFGGSFDVVAFQHKEGDAESERLLLKLKKHQGSHYVKEYTDDEWEMYSELRERIMNGDILPKVVSIKTHLMPRDTYRQQSKKTITQETEELLPNQNEVQDTIMNCLAAINFLTTITPPAEREALEQAFLENVEVGLMKIVVPMVNRNRNNFIPPHRWKGRMLYTPFEPHSLKRMTRKYLLSMAKLYRQMDIKKPRARNKIPNQDKQEQYASDMRREMGGKPEVIYDACPQALEEQEVGSHN